MDEMTKPDTPSEDLAALQARVEELERLEIQHERVEQEVSRFAARIAHDINNLLSVILASTKHLPAHVPADNPARPAVARIEKAVDEAIGLTRSLLDFSRNLPSLRKPAVSATKPSPPAAAPTGPAAMRHTVLLAEDNAQVRDLMISVLQGEGYEVVPVGDGTATMDHYRQRGPEFSLVILDLDLPGLSGRECLHEIRAGGSEVPVILATGDPSGISVDELAPNTAVLAKPFQMGELKELAASLISRGHG